MLSSLVFFLLGVWSVLKPWARFFWNILTSSCWTWGEQELWHTSAPHVILTKPLEFILGFCCCCFLVYFWSKPSSFLQEPHTVVSRMEGWSWLLVLFLGLTPQPIAHSWCNMASFPEHFHVALRASENHCLRMRSDLVPKQPLSWPLAKEWLSIFQRK